MNCQELEPWLSAFEDGELDPRRRRTVEAHLAYCPDCRALISNWADQARELRVTLARREAPQSLHSRVMRQIPEPVVRHGKRRSLGMSCRWLSVALAPAAAAIALLWGPHPISRISPPPFRVDAAAPPIEAMAPSLPMGTAIPLLLPGDPSLLHLLKVNHPSPAPRERGKRTTRWSAPPPAARIGHARKAQGRRPAESDAMRHLRHLRPARVRYRLAESFGPERRARRWRPWRALAARPSPLPARPAATPDELPRIHVVEYVLPALAPAETAPVVQAGLNL